MTTIRRLAVATIATGAVLMLAAGPGSAHECINASKQNQAAGVQLVLNEQDEIVWVSKGLQGRIDRGLVDLATGEGFSGLIGFDADGDNAADFATFIVGPNDEIPLQAQLNGATCKGIVNIGVWFEECMSSATPV
jgi:hypothetical protein